jgi:Tol biopolymer transport system component
VELEDLCPRTWSRDGKHILAVHCKKKDKTHDVVLVSVADGTTRVLKSLGPSHHLQMSLSPDGRYVVYDYPQSEGSPNRDIFLFSTDGNRELTLVEHPANDFSPFWAPDGDRIVFASDRSGSVGIWVLEVVDGKPKGSPRLINHNLNGMIPLGLTQNGSYYYGFLPGEGDVYIATLDPETGEVVIPPAKAVHSFEGFNHAPAFSPDGNRLAYVSLRPKASNINFMAIVIRSLETGEERELSPKLTVIGHFASWSPDGRSIPTSAWGTYGEKQSMGIYQIDTETSAATPVVLNNEQGHIAPIAPVWSPDGSKIFFKRHGDIKLYDLETEREWKPDFQLACGEGYGAGLAISPDGQQLAFMVSCDDDLKIKLHLGVHLSFHPDGRRIAFTGPGSGHGGEVWAMENFLPGFAADK